MRAKVGETTGRARRNNENALYVYNIRRRWHPPPGDRERVWGRDSTVTTGCEQRVYADTIERKRHACICATISSRNRPIIPASATLFFFIEAPPRNSGAHIDKTWRERRRLGRQDDSGALAQPTPPKANTSVVPARHAVFVFLALNKGIISSLPCRTGR